MRMTPKIKASPMPMSAYSAPVSRPFMQACRKAVTLSLPLFDRLVFNRLAYTRAGLLAFAPLGRRNDRLGIGCVRREHDLVLSYLYLRDQHRMLVLSAGVKVDRTKRRHGLVQGFDGVANLCGVQRSGIIHGFSSSVQRSIRLDGVICRM